MDLIFLAGNFFEDCLPRDKQYLYNYFKQEIQVAFLRYMYLFKENTYFTEHTGYACTKRHLQLMANRLVRIETARHRAKLNMDLDLLEKIEKGKLTNLESKKCQ